MNATSQSPSDPNADRATAPPGNRVPPAVPSPRRLFAIAIFAALLGLGITLSFGYADHDPRPHEVRVAVAAAPAVRAKLAAGLQHAQPGGFDLVSVPSARAATQSVRSQASAGALIVPPSGAVTIVTAGAEGVLQQQAITAALTAASRSMRRPTKPLDVAPLSSGDRAGLSSFVFGLGLLLPSVIGGVGLFLLRHAAAVVVARRGRDPVRAARRLRRRPGPGHRARGPHRRRRRADRHRIPRRALLRAVRRGAAGGRRPARHRPGGSRVHLRRQRGLRGIGAGRLPTGRLPPDRTMASEQRDRPRRAGRRLLPWA